MKGLNLVNRNEKVKFIESYEHGLVFSSPLGEVNITNDGTVIFFTDINSKQEDCLKVVYVKNNPFGIHEWLSNEDQIINDPEMLEVISKLPTCYKSF